MELYANPTITDFRQDVNGDIILDEAERDGEIALQEFEQCKELLEEKRNNVLASIEEILLKISTIQSDLSISPEDRNKKVEELYEQVILMAQKVECESVKNGELLFDYACFGIRNIAKKYKISYNMSEIRTLIIKINGFC